MYGGYNRSITEGIIVLEKLVVHRGHQENCVLIATTCKGLGYTKQGVVVDNHSIAPKGLI